MANEEIERNIHFIINQQAQFVGDLQNLINEIRRIAEIQAKSLEQQAGFQTQLGTMASVTLTMVDPFNKLAEAQAKSDAKLAELATAQAETDERLSALINMFERYLSSRNGRQEN